MPANGGLLRIGYRSPDSEIGRCRSEIADSLWQIFEIFPFLGDRDRRPGSIYWVVDLAVEYRQILRYGAGKLGMSAAVRRGPSRVFCQTVPGAQTSALQIGLA